MINPPHGLKRVGAIALGALFVCVIPGNAETFTGAAAWEKARALFQERKLKLMRPGDSAEKRFVITARDLNSPNVIQACATEAGTVTVMRTGENHLPFIIGGPDWTWMVNGSEAGTFLYLPGTHNSLLIMTNEKDQSGELSFTFAGIIPDPTFDNPTGYDITGLLPKEWKDDVEWKLETTEKEWLLCEYGAKKGRKCLYRLDPAAAWPLREILSVTPDGGISILVQTGEDVPEAWQKVTLDALFSLGPVRTLQSSPIQWKRKQSRDFFKSEEGAKMLMTGMMPVMAQFDKITNPGVDAEGILTAREALDAVIPPPPPPILRLEGWTPKPGGSTRSGWDNDDHPLPEDADVTVPLSFQGSLPLVHAKIAGKEHLLHIDTGADRCLISSTLAPSEIHNRSYQFGNHGGDLHSMNKETQSCTFPEMEIGAWQLKDPVFIVKKLATHQNQKDSIRGFLGMDLLKQHPFTIDWPGRKLTFHRRATFVPPPGAEEFPLKESRSKPRLTVRLEGVGTLEPILDTGFSGNLLLTDSVFNSHASAFEGLRQVQRTLSAPNGFVSQRMVVWPSGRPLEAGGIRREDGFGIFKVKSIPEIGDGLLGAMFFMDARVTFDLENGRLWVLRQPRAAVKERLAAGWKLEERDTSGYTPLGFALLAGDFQECKELAEAGASFEVSSDDHAMIPAVKSGDPALVEWVAAHDKTAAWKKSPALTTAIQTGARDVARWLLEHGADLSANPGAMACAAASGDIETAMLLRKAGYAFSFVGTAAMAIEENQPEFLRWLLHEDGNALRGWPTPPAVIAAKLDPACLKVLLEAGCDPLEKDADGNTALHRAALWGHAAALELLLAKVKSPDVPGNAPEFTPLHAAIHMGRADAVKMLLSHQAASEGPEGDGMPMWFAANSIDPATRKNTDVEAALEKHPHLAPPDFAGVVRALLEAGASPVRYRGKFCPAEVIAGWDHGLAVLCVEKGATPQNAPCMLNLAVQFDRGETVDFLLKNGWSPDRQASRLTELFGYALVNGHTGVIRAFGINGVDIRKRFITGDLPLNFAARHNDPWLITLIVQAGADLNAKDVSGDIPLCVAIDWRAFASARALVRAGADVMSQGGMVTPLEAAAELDPKYPAMENFLKAAAAGKQ